MDAKVFYSNDFVLSNTCEMPFVTTMISLTHSLRIDLKHWISILGKTFGAEYTRNKTEIGPLAQIDYISFAHFETQKTSIQWTFCKHTYLPELGEANTDSLDCDLSHYRVVGTDKHETFGHSYIDFPRHILTNQASPGVSYSLSKLKDQSCYQHNTLKNVKPLSNISRIMFHLILLVRLDSLCALHRRSNRTELNPSRPGPIISSRTQFRTIRVFLSIGIQESPFVGGSSERESVMCFHRKST